MTQPPTNSSSLISPTTNAQTPPFQPSDHQHKESPPASNNSTFIDMKAFPKHKHRKTLKIKAYCGKCYQFFQNGPNSKICQEHLNKQCNLISCQKHHKNYMCIRKFPNTNSANRHTHCLKREDVVHWNDEYEIRNRLLGLKRNNADTRTCTTCTNVNVSTGMRHVQQRQHNGMISPIINVKDANHNNNIKSSLHISSLTQSNNVNCSNNSNGMLNNATKSIQLFNSTNSLIKIDNNTNNNSNTNMNDTLILLPNNNSDLNNTKYLTVNNANTNAGACVNSKDTSFNHRSSFKNDEYNLKWETTTKLCADMAQFDFFDDSFDNNNPFNNSKLVIERKNSKISQHFFNEQLSQHIHNDDDDYFSPSSKVVDNVNEFEVALHDTIDTFFNVVQKSTGVSNVIKKKLIKAFRKKGILNVRILVLAFNKYNNWNFLIKKFKGVTSQIEGVTLCIEYLFRRNNLLEKL